MNKFIFAWINFFDNELYIEQIYTHEEMLSAAATKIKNSVGFDFDPKEFKSIEEMKHAAFDCDFMFEIIQI
jgi:hypothetical protein